MALEVEGGMIRSTHTQGGYSGDLQGVSRLVEGMEVSEAIHRLSGTRCDGEPTPRPDQLAQVLKQYKGGQETPGHTASRRLCVWGNW